MKIKKIVAFLLSLSIITSTLTNTSFANVSLEQYKSQYVPLNNIPYDLQVRFNNVFETAYNKTDSTNWYDLGSYTEKDLFIKQFRTVFDLNRRSKYVTYFEYFIDKDNKYKIRFKFTDTANEKDKSVKFIRENIQKLRKLGITNNKELLLIMSYFISCYMYVERPDSNIRYSQMAHSIFKNQALCAGYSDLISILCEELKLKNYIHTGTVERDKSQLHSWNYIYVDGAWYNLDITMLTNKVIVDQKGTVKATLDFDYFMQPSNVNKFKEYKSGFYIENSATKQWLTTNEQEILKRKLKPYVFLVNNKVNDVYSVLKIREYTN